VGREGWHPARRALGEDARVGAEVGAGEGRRGHGRRRRAQRAHARAARRREAGASSEEGRGRARAGVDGPRHAGRRRTSEQCAGAGQDRRCTRPSDRGRGPAAGGRRGYSGPGVLEGPARCELREDCGACDEWGVCVIFDSSREIGNLLELSRARTRSSATTSARSIRKELEAANTLEQLQALNTKRSRTSWISRSDAVRRAHATLSRLQHAHAGSAGRAGVSAVRARRVSASHRVAAGREVVLMAMFIRSMLMPWQSEQELWENLLRSRLVPDGKVGRIRTARTSRRARRPPTSIRSRAAGAGWKAEGSPIFAPDPAPSSPARFARSGT
jgi:hypothetical protein